MNSINETLEILSEADAEKIYEESSHFPLLIYKHSPICPTSFYAQKEWQKFLATSPQIKTYWVNVIASRKASQNIAALTDIRHQSPQILLLQNRVCIWNVSHEQIIWEAIAEQVKKL